MMPLSVEFVGLPEKPPPLVGSYLRRSGGSNQKNPAGAQTGPYAAIQAFKLTEIVNHVGEYDQVINAMNASEIPIEITYRHSLPVESSPRLRQHRR